MKKSNKLEHSLNDNRPQSIIGIIKTNNVLVVLPIFNFSTFYCSQVFLHRLTLRVSDDFLKISTKPFDKPI